MAAQDGSKWKWMHLEEISAGSMPPKVQQICSTGLAVHGQSTVGPGIGGNSSQQNVEETNSSPTLHQTESRLVVKGFLFVGSLCGETTICFQILLGRYKPWLQAYSLQDSLQNQGPSHFITGHLFTKWGGAPLFFMFFQSTNKTGQKRRSKSTRLLRFFGWIEILFGSHKPWILSVGRGPVKLSELSDFGWCCFALLTNCQVDSWVVRFFKSQRLQCRFFCSFSLRLYRWGRESPGTHLAWSCGYHPPSGVLFAVSQLSEMITRVNLASLVSGCTTALYTIEMADNGVEPRTSTTAIMRTFPMSTPHVVSLLVSSYLSAHNGNWVASVALDLLCDRAYSFAHQNRSSWAAVSSSLAIERVQSQTELLRWLWLKKVGKFPRHDEANE